MKQLDRIEAKIDRLLELNNPVYAETPEETQPESFYDDNNLSVEMTGHGGVRVAEVDDLLNKWLISGNKDKIQVAGNQSEYYCFLSPHRTYDRHQKDQVHANQDRMWMASMYGGQLDTYYNMKPLYVNKVTGEELYRNITQAELLTNEYVKQQERLDGVIDNHTAVAYGNLSNPAHPDWQTGLREMIIVWVETKMQYELDHLHDLNPYTPK